MLRSILLSVATASAAATVPALAHADDVEVAEPTANVAAQAQVAPSFATLDSVGGVSAVGLNTTFVTFDFDEVEDVTFARTELSAQYVSPQGLGGYLTVPVYSALIDGLDDEHDLGGVGVGGFWQTHPSQQSTLIARVGLVLPTASADVYGGFAVFTRINDIVEVTDDTWLRLSASQLVRNGTLFARFDLGLDLSDEALDSDGDEALIGRFNAAVGVQPKGNLALAVELATIGLLDTDDDEMFMNTAAVTASGQVGSVVPFLSVTLPLDEDLRGDAFGVTAGVRAAF